AFDPQRLSNSSALPKPKDDRQREDGPDRSSECASRRPWRHKGHYTKYFLRKALTWRSQDLRIQHLPLFIHSEPNVDGSLYPGIKLHVRVFYLLHQPGVEAALRSFKLGRHRRYTV